MRSPGRISIASPLPGGLRFHAEIRQRPFVIGVDQPDRVAEHQPLAMAEPRARQHQRAPFRVADAKGDAGGDQDRRRLRLDGRAARRGRRADRARRQAPTRNAESPSRAAADRGFSARPSHGARQTPAPKRRGDPLGEPGGDLALGHHRPVLDPVGVDQVDRVAVAAEGAGAGRHVVGEDPVAALALPLGAGVGDDVLGLGGKADDQRRPVVAALRRSSARMSGFSTSRSAGGPLPSFFSFCAAGGLDPPVGRPPPPSPRHRPAAPPRRRPASPPRSRPRRA